MAHEDHSAYPALITCREAARMAGCAERTVYNWFHRGLVKGAQVGDWVRINRTDLLRVLGLDAA